MNSESVELKVTQASDHPLGRVNSDVGFQHTVYVSLADLNKGRVGIIDTLTIPPATAIKFEGEECGTVTKRIVSVGERLVMQITGSRRFVEFVPKA